MIYAVTGAGPRTGTSWTMGKLREAGLPVYWTEHLKVVGAQYDTWYDDLPDLDDKIVKVWPNHLSYANIGRMVVLRRDYASQVKSIQQQIKRERKQGFTVHDTPKQLIEKANWILNKSKIERIEVRTEELDERIDEIIGWLSEPFEESLKWA
jgi:hypothetical protein